MVLTGCAYPSMLGSNKTLSGPITTTPPPVRDSFLECLQETKTDKEVWDLHGSYSLCRKNYHLISNSYGRMLLPLTHWGRVTHICVSKLTIIDSDNGLLSHRRQAIIWTNARILLIGPLRTNFSEILIEFRTFSFNKMRLKVSSVKWRPFCLGLNVLSVDKITQ